MNPHAQGILAIWHDVAEENWRETLAWYDREHHAERVDTPGFLSARRYSAVVASQHLFIRYETMNADVLSSQAYLSRVNNPTPWSLIRQPTIINNTRTVCRIAARAGRAEGGYALTLRLGEPVKGPDARALPDWEKRAAVLLARWGVVGAELWAGDTRRTTLPSREKQLRSVPDHVVDAVLVVHATNEAPLRDALRGELDPKALSGSWSEIDAGIYRLDFALQSEIGNI
jgi:hypothetical protein